MLSRVLGSAGLIATTSYRVFGSTGAPGGAARNCCAAATTGTTAITKTAALCVRILVPPDCRRYRHPFRWLTSGTIAVASNFEEVATELVSRVTASILR